MAGMGAAQLTVRGRLARGVLDALRARFDVEATSTGDRTTLTVDGLDQAAIRAVMTMLWDSGHDVMAMSTGGPPSGPTRRAEG
jgi:hypothetical protein